MCTIITILVGGRRAFMSTPDHIPMGKKSHVFFSTMLVMFLHNVGKRIAWILDQQKHILRPQTLRSIPYRPRPSGIG